MLGSRDANWVTEIVEFNPDSTWHGKSLRVGDLVTHAPQRIDPSDPPEFAGFIAEDRFRDAINQYGEGPFTVKQICAWPCGRVMIYIDSPTDPRVRGSGVYLVDMIPFEAKQ